MLLDQYGNPLALSSRKRKGPIRFRREVEGGFYDMPWPEQHMEPIGLLAATPACAALWAFLTSAETSMKETAEQVAITGFDDSNLNLRQLALSTVSLFGESLESAFTDENIRRAYAEIARCGGELNPKIRQFVNSGGHVQQEHGRDSSADIG